MMKTIKLIILIIACLPFIMSECSKKPEDHQPKDYRDKWCGDYACEKTIHYTRIGWVRIDTTYTSSITINISKSEFADSVIVILNLESHTINTKVDRDGNMENHYNFEGKFFSNSIYMNYFEASPSHKTETTINGKKI